MAVRVAPEEGLSYLPRIHDCGATLYMIVKEKTLLWYENSLGEQETHCEYCGRKIELVDLQLVRLWEILHEEENNIEGKMPILRKQ